jgi:multiple sugar transport system ATP-binding protein
MAEISLRDIRKSFGSTSVLKGVSLDIAKGEFVSLLGPSGCGKSTLLRIIAGLEAQDAGDVLIAGEDVSARRASDRNLAMVFQSYALYPHLTVRQNMMVPLRMRDLTAIERVPVLGAALPGRRDKITAMHSRVDEVAATLQIASLMNRKPAHLSGGQRQRVALGRAMVRNPVAFLMDEPLSNLDAALRVHMRTEIADLHQALGTTFVYVTHDQIEAMTMSNRIAVMLDGQIIQIGSPGEIYDNPRDIRVAQFIGSPKMNLFDALADDTGKPVVDGDTLPGNYAVAPGAALRVGIRPEHLVLTDPGQGRLSGTIRHRENLGPEILLHIAIPGMAEPMIARAEPHAVRQLASGNPVGLTFGVDHLRIFDKAGQRRDAAPTPVRMAAYG